eukprot:scaffold174715_cov29-Tisochrysis_lutea.AAC.1
MPLLHSPTPSSIVRDRVESILCECACALLEAGADPMTLPDTTTCGEGETMPFSLLPRLSPFPRLHALYRKWRNRRRWVAAGQVVLLLHAWHRRAAERAYAPGGGGWSCARDDFERRVKVQCIR